jgi:hypothetical protein
LKSQKNDICNQIRADVDLVETEASAIEKVEAHDERQAQRAERRQQQERWHESKLFHKTVQIETQAQEDERFQQHLRWNEAESFHNDVR